MLSKRVVNFFVSFLVCLALGCGRRGVEPLRVISVEKPTPVEAVVECYGVIAPVREIVVKSPASRRLARIVPDGTIVNKGDVLFELDPQGLEQQVRSQRADVEVAKAEYMRRKARAARLLHYAENRVNSARIALEVAKAELSNALAGLLVPEATKIVAMTDAKRADVELKDQKAKLDIIRELAKAGLEQKQELERQQIQAQVAKVLHRRAKVVLEDILAGAKPEEIRERELAVELAEFRLKSALKSLEETKAANERILASYQRRLDRERRRLERLEKELASLVVRSPARGMVLAKKVWGRKIVQGMYVSKGRPIVSLPDLRRMKVACLVSEYDIAKLDPKQRAHVEVAGIPNKLFEGTVTQIGSLPRDVRDDLDPEQRRRVHTFSRRVFEVEVTLVKSSPLLRPGMNARVRIVVQRFGPLVRVPKIAGRREDKQWKLWTLDAEGMPVPKLVTPKYENLYFVYLDPKALGSTNRLVLPVE